MATFYGGRQLTQTIHLAYNATLVDFTLYTAPPGFYAEFTLLYAEILAAGASISIATVSGDKEFYPGSSGEYRQQGSNILSGQLAPGNALKYKDANTFAQIVKLELIVEVFKMS